MVDLLHWLRIWIVGGLIVESWVWGLGVDLINVKCLRVSVSTLFID